MTLCEMLASRVVVSWEMVSASMKEAAKRVSRYFFDASRGQCKLTNQKLHRALLVYTRLLLFIVYNYVGLFFAIIH